MTSKKKMTEELIKTAKSQLDEALQNLENLSGLDKHALGFAAHALSNYLTVIEGTVHLLKTSLKDYPDPQVHSWLNGLIHASTLMMHTTHQLMGTSAVAKPAMVMEQVDLSVLTDRVCQFYQNRASRKNIHLTVNSKIKNRYIKADRVALAAVFDNLLSNAVKFSKPGQKIEVKITESKDKLIWQIMDEGPGIPEEEIEELFKAGSKISTMPTGKENSTGYGLAVANFLVTQMEGKIWYEPNRKRGSCFSVSMPIAKYDTQYL